MPPEYRTNDEPEWQSGKFRPLHPRECFELDALEKAVPIIPYQEYDRLVPGERPDRLDLVVEPGSSVFCVPRIPAPDSAEARRLRDFAVGRSNFLELTPEMASCRTLNIKSALLEHFYSFFFFAEAGDELRSKRLIRDNVKFRPATIALASRVAASLGSYCALHVRRNDFFGQYPEQNIPADRLLSNLLALVPTGTRLYVATDETNRSFFAELLRTYDGYFISSFNSIIPNDLPAAAIACAEQLICTFAARFIGTKLSTFSAYITRLRGYYGAADKNIYFTDGSPGSELDGVGAPRFSWTNWVRSGYPWWGREFKEGWDF